MLERLGSSHLARVMAVGLCLGSPALTACNRPSRPAISIDRCFDQPQTTPGLRLNPNPFALTIHEGVVDGDYTSISEQAQQQMEGSTIRIVVDVGDGKTYEGSGTLTKNDKGELRATTAAHLVVGKQRGDLSKVTAIFEGKDEQGKAVYQESAITGGCYTLETHAGDFADPPQNDPRFPEQRSRAVERDVASLVLARAIGTATLPVNGNALAPRAWYTTRNFGGGRWIQYNTCAIATDSDPSGPLVVSGIQPWRGNDNQATQQGSSGAGLFHIDGNTVQLNGLIHGTVKVNYGNLVGFYSIRADFLHNTANVNPHVDSVTSGAVVLATVNAS